MPSIYRGRRYGEASRRPPSPRLAYCTMSVFDVLECHASMSSRGRGGDVPDRSGG